MGCLIDFAMSYANKKIPYPCPYIAGFINVVARCYFSKWKIYKYAYTNNEHKYYKNKQRIKAVNNPQRFKDKIHGVQSMMYKLISLLLIKTL